MVQVIESEFEIGHISKPIGLSLECFDFVVDSLNKTARDVVEIVIQEPMAVVHECFGDLFQFLDAGLFGIRAPCI